MLSIVPIVEGQGDVAALPILLRRLLHERYQRYEVEIAKPKNAHGSGKLIKELERFLRLAAITPDCGAILVLIDPDDKCPKELAESLASQSKALGLGKPTEIVFAKCEYETWFLASLDTIRGRAAISETASFTGEIESLRGVKEWLGKQMPPDRTYKETADQPTLTPFIDLSLAHANSRSFRRLCHAVEQLLAAMDSGLPVVTPLSA
jgi:hypothetical protein